jgi:hypothetical protein
LSDHLEIETYTWDVLPASLKTGDITDYVTREIEWVRDELLKDQPTAEQREPPGGRRAHEVGARGRG